MQTPPHPLAGSVVPKPLRGLQPRGGPVWGPLLFIDLAIGRELRAVLPRGPGRCCAPPPSAEKLVRAVRRRPLPRPPGEMLQGKDTQAAPSRTVCLHPEAPCPGPSPSQIGGRRGGADRAKFISFPVASSNLAAWPVQVDPSLSFPECRQVLKDAREPLGTLANACPLRWYPRGPVEQLRLC